MIAQCKTRSGRAPPSVAVTLVIKVSVLGSSVTVIIRETSSNLCSDRTLGGSWVGGAATAATDVRPRPIHRRNAG